MSQLTCDPPAPAPPTGRRRQAFRLLMIGSSVSMLGSELTALAYPLLALRLTGSPFTAGWVAFAALAPSLVFYWPVGVVVERLDPLRTMKFSEIGRALAIGTVAGTLLAGRLSILLLIVMAIVEEILAVVTTLTEQRYIRALTDADHVKSTLVSTESRTHAVSLAGRPLGGFMFGLNAVLPFLFDALSFIFSAATLFCVKRKDMAEARRSWEPRHFGRDFSDGINWVLRDRYLRWTMILDCGTTIVSQALFIVFLAAAHLQGLSSLKVGMVLAASGVGGLLGSLTAAAARFKAPTRRSLLQFQMLVWVVALGLLTLLGARTAGWVALTITVLAYTGALGNIEFSTYLMWHVPEGILARVTSTENLISVGACAIGPVLGGVLAGELGIGHAVLWLFAGTLVLAVVSLRIPPLRDRDVADPPPRPARTHDERQPIAERPGSPARR